MKYIIMCGGTYNGWKTPRQLLEINGEPVVCRTIRLLREAGVDDIAISTHDKRFEITGVPILVHQNDFVGYSSKANWVDAFYPSNEPVCYLMGDVVFSSDAIKKIVETQTDDVEFFASAPPFDIRYCKAWAEPFAFKVVNTDHFFQSILNVKKMQQCGMFNRVPIAWELWQVIKNTPVNQINYYNYVAINDYTCDIDTPGDIARIEERMTE